MPFVLKGFEGTEIVFVLTGNRTHTSPRIPTSLSRNYVSLGYAGELPDPCGPCGGGSRFPGCGGQVVHRCWGPLNIPGPDIGSAVSPDLRILLSA